MTIEAGESLRREVAQRMAGAAAAWLGGLDESQGSVACGAVPAEAAGDVERRQSISNTLGDWSVSY